MATRKKVKAGDRHVHGCRRCHLRYEDNCTDPATDALCAQCRGARPWQLLIDNAAPHDCCLTSSTLATQDQVSTYRLAGTHLWFICKVCARTQPYDPTKPPPAPGDPP